jgi:hypothetical protein
MSEIEVEMENLRADAKEFQDRMIIERDIANYWYERCVKLEADMVRYAGILGD